MSCARTLRSARDTAFAKTAPYPRPLGKQVRFSRGWFAAGLLCVLSLMNSSAQQQPKVTGFFTDMHYIAQAGDVLGTEVWIVYARDRFWASVQEAEGEPDPPVTVRLRSPETR
jgi:hypothetical protein